MPLSLEEEFQKQGFSRESLKMLESEEGQLNAVYACYGSAASEGQFLEDAVRKLLTKISEGAPPPVRAGLKFLIDKLSNRITITDDRVWKSFHAARKVRNYLIHHYFRNKENKLKTQDGRMEMLMELMLIEKPIRRAKELINGMSVAVDKALTNRQKLDESIAFSLSEEVEKSHLPPYPLVKK